MKSLSPRTYTDEAGNLFFCVCGSGPFHGCWMTVRQKPGKPGALRVKSPALPPRRSAGDAEADLALYAARCGWKEAV